MKFTLRSLLIAVAAVACLCGAYCLGRGEKKMSDRYFDLMEVRMDIRDRNIVELWKALREIEGDSIVRFQCLENQSIDHGKRLAEIENENH